MKHILIMIPSRLHNQASSTAIRSTSQRSQNGRCDMPLPPPVRRHWPDWPTSTAATHDRQCPTSTHFRRQKNEQTNRRTLPSCRVRRELIRVTKEMDKIITVSLSSIAHNYSIFSCSTCTQLGHRRLRLLTVDQFTAGSPYRPTHG